MGGCVFSFVTEAHLGPMLRVYFSAFLSYLLLTSDHSYGNSLWDWSVNIVSYLNDYSFCYLMLLLLFY